MVLFRADMHCMTPPDTPDCGQFDHVLSNCLTAFVTRSIRKVILLLRAIVRLSFVPAVVSDVGFMTGEAAILRG